MDPDTVGNTRKDIDPSAADTELLNSFDSKNKNNRNKQDRWTRRNNRDTGAHSELERNRQCRQANTIYGLENKVDQTLTNEEKEGRRRTE